MAKTKENLFSKNDLAERLKQAEKELGVNTESKKNTGLGNTDAIIKNKEGVAPRLFVNGRLDRKNSEYLPKSLSLLKSLDEDIALYCRGGWQSIVNYLVYLGLETLKNVDQQINVDMKEIES